MMTTAVSGKRLRDLLLDDGIVSQEQVDRALGATKKFGGNLAETLILLGYLDLSDFEKFLGRQPGVVSIDLSSYQTGGELTSFVPEDIARTHQIFPIDKMGPLLTIGMVMPLDTEVIDQLEKTSNLRIKAVYCNPSHIELAINEHYATGDAETDAKSTGVSTIATILRKISEFPPLPETVRKMREALDDPDIEMSEVERIVSEDPLASSKIMKLANSSVYCLPRTIDSVGMAVRLFGLGGTYNLIVSSSVLSIAETASGFNYIQFFENASYAALAVSKISEAAGVRATPALSTAGLLHDIGKFAVAQAVPGCHEEMDTESRGLDSIKNEEALLGVNHAELGHAILEHWELPDEITGLVRFHHTPERAKEMCEEVNIVALASYLSESHAAGDDLGDTGQFDEVRYSIGGLGLSVERLIEIDKSVSTELNAARELG